LAVSVDIRPNRNNLGKQVLKRRASYQSAPALAACDAPRIDNGYTLRHNSCICCMCAN